LAVAGGFVLLLALFGPTAFPLAAQTTYHGAITAPQLSNVTPTSFTAEWDPFELSDETTHYQLRINGLWYGASTMRPPQDVRNLKAGNTYTVDYGVYHQGTRVGLSSPSLVLMCPDTPSGLYADHITSTTFRLRWNGVPTAESYDIFVDDALIMTVPGSPTVTTVGDLLPGLIVRVKMRAKNSTGYSNFSTELLVRLLPPTPALSITPFLVGQTSFGLSWNSIEGVSSYTVYRNTDIFAEVGSETASITVTGCVPGTYTSTRIRASNASGFSDTSQELQVLLIPASPTLLVATNIGTNSFSLAWAPVMYTAGYRVYRDREWMLYHVGSGTTKVLVNRSFNPGETATMTVTAYNAAGETPHSEELSVTLKTNARGAASLTVFLETATPEQLFQELERDPAVGFQIFAVSGQGSPPGSPLIVGLLPTKNDFTHGRHLAFRHLAQAFGHPGLRFTALTSPKTREPRYYFIGKNGKILAKSNILDGQAVRAFQQLLTRLEPPTSATPADFDRLNE
jgi:hypothetical protein